MSFDIHKYDNVIFHEHELTHKRIKVLLLWFEHEVYKVDLSLEGQVKLMDRWLKKLLKEELYEVIPFFENMKADMEMKLNCEADDIITYPKEEKVKEKVKVSVEKQTEPFLTRVQHKIRKTYRLIFKKK